MSLAGTIAGVVRDAHGATVAQARVYFTGGPAPLPDIAALTGPDGAFTLAAPAPGTYALAATAEGYATATATVAVAVGAPVQVEFWLRPEGATQSSEQSSP